MLEVNRSELKVLANRVSVVARNAGLSQPLMGEAKDGVLTLWYNGMDIVLWNAMDVNDDLELFSIPHDKFVRLINTWNTETIKLSSTKGGLTMQSGRSRVKIPHYEGAFDEIEEVPDGNYQGSITGKSINAIKVAPSFVSKVNIGRPELQTMWMSSDDRGFRVVASDSYHFYEHRGDFTHDGSGTLNSMIPINSLQVLSTLLSSDMNVGLYGIGDNYILLESDDNFTLKISIGGGQYPDVARVVELDYVPYFNFSATELLEAVKVGNVLSDDDSILLTFGEEGGIKMDFPRSVAEVEMYLDDVQYHPNAEDLSVSLLLRYLTHALNVFESDSLVFKRNSEFKATSIADTASDDTFISIIELAY